MRVAVFDRFEFLFSEALVALRRNTWMTFSAVTTVAVALFLLGGLGYAYMGLSNFASSLPGRFEMSVFLRDGAPKEQVAEAARKVRLIPGVKSVQWIPREQAWEQLRKQMPEVIEGMENSYPEQLKVTLNDLDLASEVASRIQMLESVERGGVRYLNDEQQLLSQALKLIRWLGFGVGGLMLLTSGVLIYNAIRLTILARRREIRIMQLVGATRLTVITPMLIEGIIQGALGGLLAGLLLWSSHISFERVISNFSVFGRVAPFPVLYVCAVLVGTGAIYGLVCSSVAVREPTRLKFR